MSETKTTYLPPYIIRLTDERRRRLGLLAELSSLAESEYIGRYIDREWQRRRTLVEYMEENR